MTDDALRRRLHGARLSPTDAAVLAAGLAATGALATVSADLAWIPAVAVTHFFLFCNVFRVRAVFELMWATVLCMQVIVRVAVDGAPDWPSTLLWQTPFTIGVIAAEIRSARYHGVCAHRWNPGLDAYLDARIAAIRQSRDDRSDAAEPPPG